MSDKIIKELDTVMNVVQIDEIPPYTAGTVVHDFGNNNAYEVEFFNTVGSEQHTLGVKTVFKNQIT